MSHTKRKAVAKQKQDEQPNKEDLFKGIPIDEVNEEVEKNTLEKARKETKKLMKKDKGTIKVIIEKILHGGNVLWTKLKSMLGFIIDHMLPFMRKIRFKMTVAFFVPVIFIIALGVFSYEKSKDAVVSNYETSSMGNVENSSLYCALLMNDIETKASQIAANNDFIFYYVRFESNNVVDSNTYYNDANTALNTLVKSSVGTYNAYAFGSLGNPMTTLTGAPSGSLYADFTASEEAGKWNEIATKTSGVQSSWMGYHNIIDTGAGSSSDYYAASYIRNFSKGDGFIVFDLLKTKIQEVLDNSIVSERSIAAFVTIDGRETLATGEKRTLPDQTDGKTIFAGTDFYQKAVSGESASGSVYVTFEGNRNLFVYSKIEDSGSIVCTLVPESDILSQLVPIRTTSTIFVLIACFIALFIGLLLSSYISRIIKKFSLSFKQVSEGNFAVRVQTTSKDEFGVLAHDMDDMLVKMRELVGDMASFGHNVSNAAAKVSGASEEILRSITEVSDTVNVMGQGVSEQAKDTENSFYHMTDFAGQIGEACDDTEQVGKVADKTQQIVNNGKNIINELMSQVNATAEVTNIIIKDIDDLQLQSKSIGSVVETINYIASTTNLLSLNASIEAARAGDAGRGFAVVAEQIRYLAEQSVASVKSIEKIIKSIQQKTLTTASSASRTEQMLGMQSEALNNTVKVFQDVDSHMVDLTNRINHIMKNMQTITVSKDDVLDAIKNIAAVTQQTVASSEVLEATVNNQITSVETLNSQAEEMKERARELEEAIAKFVI